MTAAELDILRFFRHYQVGPAEMLFFSPGDCKVAARHFNSAMRSLIDKDLVVKERPDRAYSLTSTGYQVSLQTAKKPPAARLKK